VTATSSIGPDPARVTRALRTSGRADGIELALLFGSRARGAARPGSDLDLAVLPHHGHEVDQLGLMGALSVELGVEAHVTDLRQAGFPLLQALLRDAVPVFEGSPHAYARWRTAAMLRVETDRPGWERMRDAFLARLAGEP
jgi:predicted nucleotidyltransferase